jgi:hypothetical protein
MTTRELVAYALLAVMAIAAVCWIAWLRYHSRERTLLRQRDRDEVRHRARRVRNESEAAETNPGG